MSIVSANSCLLKCRDLMTGTLLIAKDMFINNKRRRVSLFLPFLLVSSLLLHAILCNSFQFTKSYSTSATFRHRIWNSFFPVALYSLPREAELTFPVSSSDFNDDINSVARKTETSSIVIRDLELKDVLAAVTLCMEEYGPKLLPQYTEGMWLWDYGKIMNMWDRWALSTLITLGFQQRIQRDDHCVICLEQINKVSDDGGDEGGGEILAIAEVSLQPPYSTAPPLPAPYVIKRIMALWGNFHLKSISSSLPFRCHDSLLQAYISNVLVKETERGKGYGKRIMRAAEQRAKSMGHSTVTLHVDASPTSGKVAQAMYMGLGYQPILQMCSQRNPTLAQESSGIGDGFLSAVHFVEGIPLFYMYKNIN